MPTKLGEVLERATVPDSSRAQAAFLRRVPADSPSPIPPMNPARRQGAHRRFPLLAAVALGAAAILIAVALIPGSDDGVAPSGPLAKLAATAYAQEPNGPYEFVDWTYDFTSADGIDRRIETWAGAEERFERRTFFVDGRQSYRDATYVSRGMRVSCVGPLKRDPSCSEFDAGSAPSASAQWFEAPMLPVDPNELEAALKKEIAAEYAAGIAAGTPTMGRAEGVSGFGPSGPLEDVRADIRESIVAESLFSKLVGVVSNPYTSPELRGAAYQVMGGIEGVTLNETAADGQGRDASVIKFVPFDPFRGRPARGESYALYVDPATALVLQLDVRAPGGLDVVETVSGRRTVSELPVGAESFRDAVAEFEPPPPPIELPPAEPGPPVSLSSGSGWDLVITDDRAIVLSSHKDGSRQRTYGFANPPTLSEFDAYRAEGSPRKVFAGPVLEGASSVELVLKNGTAVEAELIDAVGLRWAFAEADANDGVASITVRDSDGSVLAKREGRRVIGE